MAMVGDRPGADVAASPAKVIEMTKAKGLQIVDLRFTDLFGMWQHFSIPATGLSDELFEEGIGFDGSSIRGFQSIDESDMLLMADAGTATADPLSRIPTLLLTCDVYDPVTRGRYTRDPRFVAQKAEEHVKKSGVATTAYFGPEAEFFVFDDIRYDQTANTSYYFIDSNEAAWNTGRDEKPNLGYKPRHKEGYFPVPPSDSLQEFRSELMLKMQEAGVEVEVHHHEVATAGQNEIDMKFAPLVRMADNVML